MATIIGPYAGHATLMGTPGDDRIIAYGAYNTIHGLGGNDYVSAGRYGHAKVFVGNKQQFLSDLHEIVLLCGPENRLNGGDENFTVTSYGIHAFIMLGDGNNNVAAYGVHNVITVGIGTNTVTAGPHSTVVVSGNDYFGSRLVAYQDTLRFSGAGNSLSIQASGGKYPLTGTVDVSGGTGSGTFDLGWSDGTFTTGGRSNVVTAGFSTMDISPGSGGDTVHLYGINDVGGQFTIHLAGDHNEIDGQAHSSVITGGDGFTTIVLAADVYMPNGPIAATLGGQGNDVALTGFSGTVDAGSGQDTVRLTGSFVTAVFHGAGNMAFIQDGGATIDDQSSGLQIQLAGTGGATVVDHFGAARGAVVDLLGSPFATASDAFAAMTSDGAGGSILVFPGTGGIHFVGFADLTAANFKIG